MIKTVRLTLVISSFLLIMSFMVYGVYALKNQQQQEIDNLIEFHTADVDVIFNANLHKIGMDKIEGPIISSNINDTLAFDTNDVFKLNDSYVFAYTMRIKVVIGKHNFNQRIKLNINEIFNPSQAEIKYISNASNNPLSFDTAYQNGIDVVNGYEIYHPYTLEAESFEIVLLVVQDVFKITDPYEGNIGFLLLASKNGDSLWLKISFLEL